MTKLRGYESEIYAHDIQYVAAGIDSAVEIPADIPFVKFVNEKCFALLHDTAPHDNSSAIPVFALGSPVKIKLLLNNSDEFVNRIFTITIFPIL